RAVAARSARRDGVVARCRLLAADDVSRRRDRAGARARRRAGRATRARRADDALEDEAAVFVRLASEEEALARDTRVEAEVARATAFEIRRAGDDALAVGS